MALPSVERVGGAASDDYIPYGLVTSVTHRIVSTQQTRSRLDLVQRSNVTCSREQKRIEKQKQN